MTEPCPASEHKHSEPSQSRIDQKRGSKLRGDISSAPHEFHPSEHQEKQKRRPHSKPFRIGPAKTQRGAFTDSPIGVLDNNEDRVPGIDQRPYVSKQETQNSEAHPTDNPDHHRRNVSY